MAELSEICQAARAAAAGGEPLWLATVVRVQGSAYRHAGARLLFTNGRALAGSVSGGCLEATVVRKGPWLAREQPACLYFEGAREDEEDASTPSGTGCDGSVDILVERVLAGAADDPLVFIDDCLSREQRGALVTVFESSVPQVPLGSRLSLREDGEQSSSIRDQAAVSELASAARSALADSPAKGGIIHGAQFEALLEIIEPAAHLFVFGSGPDAVPVVEFAHALGLGVTVCDTTARLATRERFAGRAELHVGSVSSMLPKIEAHRTPLAVVMSHHYATDAQAVEMLLESHAAYIGVLGPARRTARILRELPRHQSNLGPRDRARLRAPIGLDLGAETPTQIALSIVSEIQAVLCHASAEPLSRRAARPIHPAEQGVILPSPVPWARTGST